MPVPVAEPRRIVIMGDTGCRLSDGHGLYQECNNDSLWPFAHVARSVEALNPDLIIYTGDYICRESPCPAGDNGCAGSPYGDTQATWEADWLIPAEPVHSAAPLILVRGNHEVCSRPGDGWFRYLDARPFPAECMESTDPWVVTFRRMQVAVRMVGLPATTQLLAGAHIHLAEVLDFGRQRPPQLVVANSGTQLVPRVEPPGEIDGVAIQSQEVIYQFGFVSMASIRYGRWRIEFRDVDGRKLEHCILSGKRVFCRPD